MIEIFPLVTVCTLISARLWWLHYLTRHIRFLRFELNVQRLEHLCFSETAVTINHIRANYLSQHQMSCSVSSCCQWGWRIYNQTKKSLFQKGLLIQDEYSPVCAMFDLRPEEFFPCSSIYRGDDIYITNSSCHFNNVYTTTQHAFMKTPQLLWTSPSLGSLTSTSGVICLASHHFRGVPALSSLTLGWVMLSLFEHANQVWRLYELQTTVCAVAVSESRYPNDHRDNHLGLTLWSCRHVWLRSPADQLCCGFFILLHEPYRQLRLKTCSLFRKPQQESGSIRFLHCFLESPRINFKGKYHKNLPPY